MDEKDANRFNEATERMAEAARESYKTAVDRAFATREGNMRLARSFFEDWVDTLEAQTELNRRAVQGLVELAREQQEAFRALSHPSLRAYDGFLDSLFSYYKEILGERSEDEEDPADQL